MVRKGEKERMFWGIWSLDTCTGIGVFAYDTTGLMIMYKTNTVTSLHPLANNSCVVTRSSIDHRSSFEYPSSCAIPLICTKYVPTIPSTTDFKTTATFASSPLPPPPSA